MEPHRQEPRVAKVEPKVQENEHVENERDEFAAPIPKSNVPRVLFHQTLEILKKGNHLDGILEVF